MSTILVLLEHDDGEPLETSLEMLSLASELAGATDSEIEAVVFDTAGSDVAQYLDGDTISRVHGVTHPALSAYAPRGWAATLEQLVDAGTEAILAPGTDRGHETLAHVGASLDAPMAANCTAVDVGEEYEVTRLRWGGSVIEHAELAADTKLLTTAEHELPPVETTGATDPDVEEFQPDLEDEHRRVQVDRYEESDVEGVPLGEARVVVSGGRGVGGPDGFDQLEELADLLGGTVGASRAAVNEGWRPHDDQVGLTGAKISPDIYIACGISGAVQHMVGCKGAEVILAINTDPEAAIMQKGEYAVIGDLHEVVPALNEAIRDEA